jgi:hypothetical protein
MLAGPWCGCGGRMLPDVNRRVHAAEESRMLDAETQAQPRNSSRIEIDEPDELAYWTDALEVDEATLRGAIQAVGFGAGDVRDYLKWRQAATAAS